MTKLCVICNGDVKSGGPGTRGMQSTYTAYQSEVMVYGDGYPDKAVHTNQIQYVCSRCAHRRVNAELAQELENATERSEKNG